LQTLLAEENSTNISADTTSSSAAHGDDPLDLDTLLSRVLAIAKLQDQIKAETSTIDEECSLNLVAPSSAAAASNTMQQLTMALANRSYTEALSLYMQVMDPWGQVMGCPAC
jgi:hypothetical protein